MMMKIQLGFMARSFLHIGCVDRSWSCALHGLVACGLVRC
jgi:hypothetical protein